MMLRLFFGGAPCPLEWGTISESVCDLINAILQHDNWDPLTLFATAAQAHVPPKEVLSDDVLFVIRQDLIVDIPVNARGIVDVYIDDFFGLTVDLEDSNNATRLEWAHSPWTNCRLQQSLPLQAPPTQRHGRSSETLGRDWTNQNQVHPWLVIEF